MKPGVIDDRDKFMRGVDRAEKNDAILIKTQQTRSMDGGICYFFLQVAALNNSVFKKKKPQTKITRARTMLSRASCFTVFRQ